MDSFRVFSLLPIVALAGTATASSPAPPFVGTTAAVYSAASGPAVFDCEQSEDVASPSLASSSCGTGFSTGIAGAGSSSSSAAPGTLRASSSAQASGGLGIGDANASAHFADSVSANAAGTLHAEMTVDGNVAFDAAGALSSAYAFYNLDFYTADFTTVLDNCGTTFQTPGAAGESCSVDTPVQAGQVVVLYGNLTVASGVSMGVGSDPNSASADFANTAAVSLVELLDDHGQPIRDAVIQFGSGASYPVPEPAGALPLAAAIGTLAATRRRRR